MFNCCRAGNAATASAISCRFTCRSPPAVGIVRLASAKLSNPHMPHPAGPTKRRRLAANASDRSPVSHIGLGAGAFYSGYCLFEVPSNLISEKVGARLWLARILITWGLFSSAMAFVGGPVSIVALRFLLGAAEAGFFPGILHYWFPGRRRGRMIAWFTVATPISVALGGPISIGPLGLDGMFGLAGWNWVFLVEGAPAVILGFLLLTYLRDRPAHAAWLNQEEKDWIETELARERRELESVRTYTLFLRATSRTGSTRSRASRC
jgi:MFS family permease